MEVPSAFKTVPDGVFPKMLRVCVKLSSLAIQNYFLGVLSS